jgi:hypothetical protein
LGFAAEDCYVLGCKQTKIPCWATKLSHREFLVIAPGPSAAFALLTTRQRHNHSPDLPQAELTLPTSSLDKRQETTPLLLEHELHPLQESVCFGTFHGRK